MRLFRFFMSCMLSLIRWLMLCGKKSVCMLFVISLFGLLCRMLSFIRLFVSVRVVVRCMLW